MNLTIVLFVVSAVSVEIGANKDTVDPELMKQCVQETGVDPTKLRFDDEYDQSIKCYHTCMLKKTGLMTEDGTINKRMIMVTLPSDISERERKLVLKSLDICTEINENDACDNGYRITKCLLQRN